MTRAVRRAFFFVVLGILLAFVPKDVSAQEPSPVSGSLRLGAWTSTRALDDRQGAATLTWWAKGRASLGPRLSAYAEGWAGYQDLGHRAGTSGLLREAYLDLSLGPLDVRAGRQIIVWGRADGINPTDNVGSRDFTLLVADDDDQRFGLGAFKASLYAGSISVTGFWLPEPATHVVPIPGLSPAFTFREVRPGPSRTLTQGAVRLEQSGLAVDWSLSYFDGCDRSPNLALDLTTSAPVLLLRHPRVRVLGGDVATVVGRFGLRGEAAYTLTEDTRGDDPDIKNSFFKGVVGGDRTFFEYLNVNAQYVLQIVAGFHDPAAVADPDARALAVQSALASNQWDRVQHGATLRVSDKWLNETLETELSAASFGPTAAYLVRGRVHYALTDRWYVSLGFDRYDGVEPSPLRFLRKNSLAFAEMRLAM